MNILVMSNQKPRTRTTITIRQSLLRAGRTRAKSFRPQRSFSNYVEWLILRDEEEDAKKAPQPA